MRAVRCVTGLVRGATQVPPGLFSLLTMKPWLVALNVAEEDLVGERAVGARQLAEQRGLPWISLRGAGGRDRTLPPEERAAFAADYGLVEPGRERLIHAAYRLLEVITFFTGGPTEAHAWTLSAGATAVEAAGRIHTTWRRVSFAQR